MINWENLPSQIKLEVSKADLMEFAKMLIKEQPKGKKKVLPPQQEDFIKLKEVCKMTGLAKQTIYGRVSRGQIPHYKKGRLLYFKRSEIREWIELGKGKTREDIDAIADDYINRRN